MAGIVEGPNEPARLDPLSFQGCLGDELSSGHSSLFLSMYVSKIQEDTEFAVWGIVVLSEA